MMVFLDKKPARFDSIYRNIPDEKEAIYCSKGGIYARQEEREDSKKYYLRSRIVAGGLEGTSMSFFMKFNH